MQHRRYFAGALVVLGLIWAARGACGEFPSFNPEPGQTLTGIAYAIDGDTIKLGKVHVRLQGVAAPERDERGGTSATEFMKRLVNGKQGRCELDGTHSYSRVVGICYFDGRDIGAEVISAGLARDCPRYSKGRYSNLEPLSAENLPFPNYCKVRHRQ